MGFEKRQQKWPWRDFLTAEEFEVVDRAESAKKEWERLNQQRSLIQNRAIHRAKYHATNPRHNHPEGEV